MFSNGTQELASAIRTYTETGDLITANLQGIGSQVRTSRTYHAIEGITASYAAPGSSPVPIPIAPALSFGGPVAFPGLAWGHTYYYSVTLVAPDGAETPIQPPLQVRTPTLPPAPVVTAEVGAGAVWTQDRVYALSKQYIGADGQYYQTPIGPVTYAFANSVTATPKNFRISVPDCADCDPADARYGDATLYILWRTQPPAPGGAYFWTLDGRVAFFHAGDSLLDNGTLPATVASPAVGFPRVTLTPSAAPIRPDLSYRVYGREPGEQRLLVTLPAGSTAAWVDNGTAVPLEATAPSFPTGGGSGGFDRLYNELNTHQWPFRSRLVRIEAPEQAIVVQLDPGAGQFGDELTIAGVRELKYSGDRARVRSADISGGVQSRYRIEVWD